MLYCLKWLWQYPDEKKIEQPIEPAAKIPETSEQDPGKKVRYEVDNIYIYIHI